MIPWNKWGLEKDEEENNRSERQDETKDILEAQRHNR